ncbi:MAG TPA: hypothetical protein VMV29_07055 [Ktedonobacterales bacterium]|nr:hypothetical protein [Ktedonobacterales bacterium]
MTSTTAADSADPTDSPEGDAPHTTGAPLNPTATPTELPSPPAVGPLFWVTAADGTTKRDLPEWREYTGQAPFASGDRRFEPALHPDDTPLLAQRWAKRM